MNRLFIIAAAVILAVPAFATTFIVTVAGLGGEPDYEARFALLATDTDKVLRTGQSADRVIETLQGPAATKAKLISALNRVISEAKPQDAFVLMMIGHGTFDGAEYKFNLPGPDISAPELAALLNRISATRQLVVDMTSASGGAAAALKHANRTIITATRSGAERNATVFARFWVEALRDPVADTDKNGQVTALEAFHYAQSKTTGFYTEQKHLMTEHAQLDDQQRAGTFTLVRYGSAAAEITDPAKKQLVAKKEQIENQIDALKYQKDLMAPEDYRKQLTGLLLELAKTQAAIDK